jgi:hypothetical protein
MSLREPTEFPSPLPPPGERIELPERGEFLWINFDERGRAFVDEISLDPTPYQLGDYVSLKGKPGQRRLHALVHAAPIHTFWLEFPPDVSEEDRDAVTHRLASIVMRHNQDESRLALVVPRWAKKRVWALIQSFVDQGRVRSRAQPMSVFPMSMASWLLIAGSAFTTSFSLVYSVFPFHDESFWAIIAFSTTISAGSFMCVWALTPLNRSSLGKMIVAVLGLATFAGCAHTGWLFLQLILLLPG